MVATVERKKRRKGARRVEQATPVASAEQLAQQYLDYDRESNETERLLSIGRFRQGMLIASVKELIASGEESGTYEEWRTKWNIPRASANRYERLYSGAVRAWGIPAPGVLDPERAEAEVAKHTLSDLYDMFGIRASRDCWEKREKPPIPPPDKKEPTEPEKKEPTEPTQEQPPTPGTGKVQTFEDDLPKECPMCGTLFSEDEADSHYAGSADDDSAPDSTPAMLGKVEALISQSRRKAETRQLPANATHVLMTVDESGHPVAVSLTPGTVYVLVVD